MAEAVNNKISVEQAREALLRSGYLLESRLETVLKRRGYYVEANAAYPDPETGKSRELDVYAMFAKQAGPEEMDFIFSVLLIECVNNAQPVAFITKEPQVGFLHYKEAKLAGLPVKLPGADGSWVSVRDFLGMEKYHHYCQGRVATQFCSFSLKQKVPRSEWMASHDSSHFDCLKKLCDAVDHFTDRHFESWVFRGRESINIEFYYPVVVVQGELLEVRLGKTGPKIGPTEHLQFRRSAVVNHEERDYQIDIVTEGFFSAYLGIVNRELTKHARTLSRQHDLVRKAVNKICRQAKRYRSKDKIRNVMDF